MEAIKRGLVVGHKSDARSVYDEEAKWQLVALCLQLGASVWRLAREFGVNAKGGTLASRAWSRRSCA